MKRRPSIGAAGGRPVLDRRPRRRLARAFESALILLSAVALAVLASSASQPWGAPSSAHSLRLQKAGMPAALARLARLAEASPDELAPAAVPQDWAAARLEAYKGGGGAPGPPPPHCTIMLNDDYRLIFLKCPRTGTSALLEGYFSECGVRPKQGLRESPFCLVWLDVGNPSHVTHLAAKWGEYTAFGFSRNILARGIGQYVYLSSQLGPDCPSISWDDFCRDPYVLGDVCAATAADGRACCKVSADHNYALVAPQSDCFATADGLPAVDWLGRMESLDSDFADLIRLLNGRRGVPRLPAPPARLPRINYHASPCHDSPPADAVMQPEAQAGQQQGQQPAKQPEEEQQPAEKQGEQQAETAKQEDQPADKQEEQPAEAAKQQEQQPTAEKQEEQQAEAGKQGEQPAAEKQPADKQEQKPADKQEEQPAAEKQEGGGRRLAGVPWQARPGTYLPCDAGNYFTAQHAHCAADLLEFFAADVNFFQTLAFRSQRSGMLQ